MSCPACQNPAGFSISVERERLPVFQNVVWPSAAEARNAPTGRFRLTTCMTCGFSFNSEFRGVEYDDRYDNCAPSATFEDYLQSLIAMLLSELNLSSGTVYDIGCGKGEFLRMLCRAAPGIRGVGIDPSCTPTEEGNFRLIQAFVEPAHFGSDAALVICRHVVEHMAEPVGFLSMLRESIPDVPLFVEVPELQWIFRNGAFWDFCYEHCNYFTPETLRGVLQAAGFVLDKQSLAFGGQYQWALCRPGEKGTALVADPQAIDALSREYLAVERSRMREVAARSNIAIWGMATKGVILATMLPPEALLGGIDVNPAKQGKFAAGSGVEIHPPEWIRTLPPGTQVLVMNPNYLPEIEQTVAQLGAKVELVPA